MIECTKGCNVVTFPYHILPISILPHHRKVAVRVSIVQSRLSHHPHPRIFVFFHGQMRGLFFHDFGHTHTDEQLLFGLLHGLFERLVVRLRCFGVDFAEKPIQHSFVEEVGARGR